MAELLVTRLCETAKTVSSSDERLAFFGVPGVREYSPLITPVRCHLTPSLSASTAGLLIRTLRCDRGLSRCHLARV